MYVCMYETRRVGPPVRMMAPTSLFLSKELAAVTTSLINLSQRAFKAFGRFKVIRPTRDIDVCMYLSIKYVHVCMQSIYVFPENHDIQTCS